MGASIARASPFPWQRRAALQLGSLPATALGSSPRGKGWPRRRQRALRPRSCPWAPAGVSPRAAREQQGWRGPDDRPPRGCPPLRLIMEAAANTTLNTALGSVKCSPMSYVVPRGAVQLPGSWEAGIVRAWCGVLPAFRKAAQDTSVLPLPSLREGTSARRKTPHRILAGPPLLWWCVWFADSILPRPGS